MDPNNFPTMPPMPPNPNPNPNPAPDPDPHPPKRAVKTVKTAFIVFLVLGLIHLIIAIFGIVDAVKHCKDNTAIQILLLLFVPFYTIIYLFIRKSSCPRTK